MTPTHCSRPRSRTTGALALAAAALLAGPAAAQTTYTWDATKPLGAWLDPANWTGGTPGTTPGSPGGGTASDVARIDSFVISSPNNLGINMPAIGGQLSLGAFHLGNGSTSLRLGNSDPNGGPGVLRLNGATVPIDGVNNVILANTSGFVDLTLQNAVPTGGNQLMTVRLGTTNGVVLVNGGRAITVTSAVDQVTAGSGITVRGGGTLNLNSTVGYTGATNVLQGTVVFGAAGTATLAGGVRNEGWVAGSSSGTRTFAGPLSGAGNWAVLSGRAALNGVNTHTGTTFVLPGSTFQPSVLAFGSAAATGGAAARYHFTSGGALSAGYAIDQGLLNRIDPASRGYIDMGVDSGNALDFSALPNVGLGVTGNPSALITRTYSGSITPYQDTYRFGGGSGRLIVASTLTGAARSVLVTGEATLTGANSYGGPTVIDAGGQLVTDAINNGGTVGPLGSSSAAAANLVLRGGRLSYTGTTDTTDRGLTIQGGAFLTGPVTGVLGFTGDLARGPQATLHLNRPTVALSTVNTTPIAQVPVGGIVPWAVVAPSDAATAFAAWNGTALVAATPDYVTLTDGPLSAAPAAANAFANSAQTLAANKPLNSLLVTDNVTVSPGATLTLASGGLILRASGSNPFNLLGGGAVTSALPGNGVNELYVYASGSGFNEARIEPTLVNNGATPLVLVKHGPGPLALKAANAHTGGTVVNAGTVFADNTAALGAGTAPVTINPGGAGVLARVTGTIANPVTVPAGGGDALLGTRGLEFSSPAETVFAGAVTFDRPLTLAAGNNRGTRFTGAFTGTADVTISNGTFASTVGSVILDTAGTNTFGNLYLGTNAGLQLGTNTEIGNRQIPDTATVYFAPGSGIIVRRSRALVTPTPDGEAVNALVSQAPGAGAITVFENGSVFGTTFTLTVGAGNGSGDFGGRIGETGAPPRLEFVKVGTGTQVLSGINTYTGGTRVEAGTLLVNNPAGSGTGSGSVEVTGGTLGGNGAVVFPVGTTAFQVTVRGGGRLAPGTGDGVGQADLEIRNSGGLVMDPGAVLRVKLFGTAPDAIGRLTVAGPAGIDTAAPIELDLAGVDAEALRAEVGVGNSRTYTVLTASTLTGAGRFGEAVSVIAPGGFLPGEWVFDSFDTVNDRVTLRFSPVPEPAAVLAVAASVAGLGLAGLRRKKIYVV